MYVDYGLDNPAPRRYVTPTSNTLENHMIPRILVVLGVTIAAGLVLAACNTAQDPNRQTVDVYHHNLPASGGTPGTVLHIVSHVNAPTTTVKPKPTVKRTAPAKPGRR